MSAPTRRGVYRSTVLHLVTERPPYPQAAVGLSYTADDPHAITVRFPGGPVWQFGRDLLAQGLFTMSGYGDVRIGPHLTLTCMVEIHLAGDGCTGVFLADAPTLDRFLDDTLRLVPMGSEYAGWDIDAALADLCEGAA